MTVTDPEGGRWRVARRWLPWRRRSRMADPGPIGGFGGGGDDILSLLLLVLGLVVAGFVLLVALELLLLVVLLPFVLLGRVVLGRDWVVAVRRHREPWTDVRAGDWQASELLVHELAAAIEQGSPPPRTIGEAA